MRVHLVLVLVVFAAGHARADSPAVSTVAGTTQDAEVLQHLAGLIDRPLMPREGVAADDLPGVLRQASTWPGRHVLVVNRAGGMLHVVDAREGTIVTRLLVDESVRSAPYAVAFIAAELLGLSEQLVEVREASAADVHAGAAELGPEPEPAGERDGFALGLSAEWTRYPASGVVLWRPAFEAWWRPGGRSTGLRPLVGLRASLLGDWTGGTGEQPVELTQHDADLRVGLASELGASTLVVALAIGAQWVEAGLAPEPARDRELLARLGLALQVRHRLVQSLSFCGGVEGIVTPVATRYAARGEELVAPARLGVSVNLGLAWDNRL